MIHAWEIDEADLEAIALGAAILGTGGGGSPYLGKLQVRRYLRAGPRIRVIPLESLPDDALVIPCGIIGAPTVGIEKLARGDECYQAVRALEAYVGQPATVVIADEIGGSNALEPMIVAALAGLPVVDGDAMGRAFPEVQMETFFIYGTRSFPAALCDEKGNRVVFHDVIDARWLERLARAATIQMGCRAGMAGPPLSGAQIRQLAIPGTVRQAWQLGRSVLEARRVKADPIQAILEQEKGKLLFQGKITDVARWTTQGFAKGRVTIEGTDNCQGETLVIDFQNENLIARAGDRVLATVPDLICIVDQEAGQPIQTEELRYGFRVAVLGLPCSPLLRTPEALAVVGPQAFGLDACYRPLVP